MEICRSCNGVLRKDDIAITAKGLVFHQNCAYDFAQMLLRTYEIHKPQPDFATKNEASNQLQFKDMACADNFVQALVYGYKKLPICVFKDEKKPEPQPEQPKKKRGYEWL